jgi:hypothetical protein|tara:strand:- start:33886 stop:34302 length:417 start_codon:yes stop_codon:yes gene_type:complete
VKVKVSDLEGRALNYAVAFVQWGEPKAFPTFYNFGDAPDTKPLLAASDIRVGIDDCEYNPSGNWAHGGPLIESACISVFYHSQPDMGGNMWYGACGRNSVHKLPRCKSPLVAACRAYVFSCVREEIEIPDELMEASHA